MSELPLQTRAQLLRERLERSRLGKNRPTEEEITPHSGWTQEPNLHSLLIELPGFKEGDIKLKIEKPGCIDVSGERLITAQNKRVHFDKALNVPEDSDMKNITMKFQGDVLKVSIPRVVKEKRREPELKTNEALVCDNPKEEEKQEEKKEEPIKIKTDEALLIDSKEEKKEEPIKNKTDEALLIDSKEKNKEEPEIKTDEALNSGKEENKEKENPEIKTDEAVVSDSNEQKKGEQEIKTDEALVKDESKEGNAQKTSENDKENERSNAQEETHRDQKEETFQKSVIGKISEKKGILLASIISFTLGYLFQKDSNLLHLNKPCLVCFIEPCMLRSQVD